MVGLPLWGLVVLFTCGVFGDFVSSPPIPSDKTTPIHQRLAFRGPTAMVVAWNTFQQIATPTVHYGTRIGTLTFSASSDSSVTFPTSRTWANTVVLTGLQPYTTYYYKIESTNSSVLTFTTARIPAAAVIDMGLFGKDGMTVPASKRHLIPRIEPGLEHTTIGALDRMSSEYDFIIHPGDIAYADNWITANPLYAFFQAQAYESITERFFLQLQPISGIKPYMVGPGNHEATCVEMPFPCAAGQKNFSSFINRYGLVMPTATTINSLTSVAAASARTHASRLAKPPFWYSFDYGMAHFVMFDTETDLGNGIIGPDEPGGGANLGSGPFGGKNQQFNFLQQDLASVDRAVTRMITLAQLGWYSSKPTCSECQKAFESLFIQYGVDLAVFGHVHNMQEIAPIANDVVDPAGLNNPKAPWYIVTGAAGNIEGLAPLGEQPSYITWADDTVFGFSKLLFQDRNRLTVQFIRSRDGVILRNSTLYKAHTTRFVGALAGVKWSQ
ncbi:Metallo-dependent phosphatase-like protein [Cantharellus anzutake]|uniref:Metallo-dependent phosphatase-like protein n=1 Tax=Cantharellus anzutake TaxID=1750568 RepID=UPI0019059F1B|nr:Metallo-dependent phosphatase-like protein [Cantharellus anzutake]KAF8319499.1 Metallo-dependent phosphatase-like protein [Cantharellus anzutake]